MLLLLQNTAPIPYKSRKKARERRDVSERGDEGGKTTTKKILMVLIFYKHTSVRKVTIPYFL